MKLQPWTTNTRSNCVKKDLIFYLGVPREHQESFYYLLFVFYEALMPTYSFFHTQHPFDLTFTFSHTVAVFCLFNLRKLTVAKLSNVVCNRLTVQMLMKNFAPPSIRHMLLASVLSQKYYDRAERHLYSFAKPSSALNSSLLDFNKSSDACLMHSYSSINIFTRDIHADLVEISL